MSFNYDVISDLLRKGCPFSDILEAYGMQDDIWEARWRKYKPKVYATPDPLSEVSFF